MNLTDYERGWVEGYIDAECSLSMIKERRADFARGFRWRAFLESTNTSAPLLQKFCDILKLRRPILLHKEDAAANRRAFFYIMINHVDLEPLLSQITLIAKERQRVLLLEALRLIAEYKGNNQFKRLHHNDKRLGEIYAEMKTLNRRGVRHE